MNKQNNEEIDILELEERIKTLERKINILQYDRWSSIFNLLQYQDSIVNYKEIKNMDKEQKLRQILGDYNTGKISITTFIDKMQDMKKEYGL